MRVIGIRKSLLLIILGILWLSALAGFALLAYYDLKPGSNGQMPLKWPANTCLALANKGCTAVVFLHPQCPCSIATIDELEKIIDACAHAGSKLKVYAEVWQPSSLESTSVESTSLESMRSAPKYSAPIRSAAKHSAGRSPASKWPSLADSKLVRLANNVVGIDCLYDQNGTQAKLFGAKTSGYLMLYGPSGKLLYAGGVTSSRGHEGDNTGADLVVAAVMGLRKNPVTDIPVFGCGLADK